MAALSLDTREEPEFVSSHSKVRLAKPAYGYNLYRGFESRPLRHPHEAHYEWASSSVDHHRLRHAHLRDFRATTTGLEKNEPRGHTPAPRQQQPTRTASLHKSVLDNSGE